jgi:hypothetical protein
VLQIAVNRLSSNSYRLRSSVTCEYERGVLTINGELPSFYLKQMVQSLLRNLDGVERLENRIVVVNPTGMSHERGE